MKRFFIRNIKKRKLYTIKEAAEAIRGCEKSIRRMIKEGLPVLEKNAKPILILGLDLLNDVKKKNSKHKVDVKDDEFLCFTSKTAVQSVPEDFQIIFTRRRWGKTNYQAKLVGVCPKCKRPLNKFTTEKKIISLVKQGVFDQKHITVLIDT